jgi:hypothetical protein
MSNTPTVEQQLPEKPSWNCPELVPMQFEEIEAAADLDIVFACSSCGWCDVA